VVPLLPLKLFLQKTVLQKVFKSKNTAVLKKEKQKGEKNNKKDTEIRICIMQAKKAPPLESVQIL